MYGGGVGAITLKKVRQMRFAAELYAARHPAMTSDRLLVIARSAGSDFELFELE